MGTCGNPVLVKASMNSVATGQGIQGKVRQIEMVWKSLEIERQVRENSHQQYAMLGLTRIMVHCTTCPLSTAYSFLLQ